MAAGREKLAVSRPDPYVYKSRLKRGLAGLVDGAMGAFSGPATDIPWDQVREVVVLRLDHLGDVLFALPALQALKKALPRARIRFFTGPWGAEMAALGQVAEVEIFEAPWFRRPSRRAWSPGPVAELASRLKGAEVAIDLRGDLRHLWAMKRAGIPYRAGQAITGGRFLLTHPARYDSSLHEIEQNLSLLRQAGLNLPAQGGPPSLKPSSSSEKEALKVWKGLGLKGPVVAFQVTCGAASKCWLPENWAKVIDALPAGTTPVLLGTEAESAQVEAVAALCRRSPVRATGLLPVPALAAFLKRCSLLVSLNTGPSHLAAAMGTPVVALFAGTDVADQWAPRGPRVRVIQKQVPCAPCGLSVCPYDNECMRLITVDEVKRAVTGSLRVGR